MIELGNSGIVEILCSNEAKKKDLISLISGTQNTDGVCAIGKYNSKEQPEEYKKKIEVVDIERIDSLLSVRNYLVFYSMVTGIYNERTITDFEQLLEELGMAHIMDQTVQKIDKVEKIIVRCLGAYSKKIICLVGKNLLLDLEQTQKERLIQFFRRYFVENRCLCLLFENSYEDKSNIVDKVITI